MHRGVNIVTRPAASRTHPTARGRAPSIQRHLRRGGNRRRADSTFKRGIRHDRVIEGVRVLTLKGSAPLEVARDFGALAGFIALFGGPALTLFRKQAA